MNTYQVVFDLETLAPDSAKAFKNALEEVNQPGVKRYVSCIRNDSLSSSGKDIISEITERIVVLDARGRQQLESILSRLVGESEPVQRLNLVNEAMRLL